MKFILTATLINFSMILGDPCSAPLLGASHSGAPGEVNCSGCHSGSPNTGPGTVNYLIGDDITTYSWYKDEYIYNIGSHIESDYSEGINELTLLIKNEDDIWAVSSFSFEISGTPGVRTLSIF